MKPDQIQRLSGTRDFYPEEMRLRAWLLGKMRDVAGRYGYEEYDGPFLEPYELYPAKSGEELAGEEMYTLTDRGEAVVRNLQTGEQATVTMGTVEPAVRAIAGRRAPEEV